MGIFTKLYDKTKKWASHQKAPKYLAALSFAESSFFPIPPDVMLGPMCIAKPWLSFRFAYIAILFSVLGGVFGYCIGFVAFESIVDPLLHYFNYVENYETALVWFKSWGFWAIVVAGFTPIPYKLFTIGAGVLQFNIFLFIVSSIVGRSLRFFLVSGLIRFGGARFETALRKYVDTIGWIFFAIILVFCILKTIN